MPLQCPISSPVYPRCLCSLGWTGVDCAEDVDDGPLCNHPYDPCDPLHNPCLHNSTCLTRSNGTASCRCPAGEDAMAVLYLMALSAQR
ncbi:hypothetical protein F7725_024146 [Dissostichus mawsoni]|uniref:EGF-like domain-containing protein n=1 Tax=Dissostichus mawsoni TaxID=36200 RepID=A0A7J5XYI9_DISMA|nr:hypothetical protein F7725_024146 [Dissostichus mawsoni]